MQRKRTFFSSFISASITFSESSSSSTGQVSAVTFQQAPSQIVKEKTEVHINCSHNDNDLLLMLWYQQRKDSLSMTLIGYGYESTPNYEGQFKGTVQADEAKHSERNADHSQCKPVTLGCLSLRCQYTVMRFNAPPSLKTMTFFL